MSQIPLVEDASSLLSELDYCRTLAHRNAPDVMSFKNEIARMRLEANRLSRQASAMELAYRAQRQRCPQRDIDELALAIQHLRNNILFLKSRVASYKQWYRMDSPCSDRHYSSDSTVGFSPRRGVTGLGTGSRAFSSSQPTLSNSQQSTYSSQYSQYSPQNTQNSQNRYSYFPSPLPQSQGSQSNCGHGGNQRSSSGECLICRFKRNNAPRSSYSGRGAQPNYSFPSGYHSSM